MAATIAISYAESFVGQVLALSLADELLKRDENDGKIAVCSSDDKDPVKQHVVCLVRDPKNVPLLDEHPRCRVVSIAYQDRTTIELALEGISTVVLVPESEENQLELAEILISAMEAKNVLRCTLISLIGTDAPEKEHLIRYMHIEDQVMRRIQHWTVLRRDFVLQSLLHWVTMARKYGRIAMSINENSVFAPVDIHDLALAVNTIVLPRNRRSTNGNGNDVNVGNVESHDGQIYTVTGPIVVSGPILAMQLSDALDTRTPISVEPASPDKDSGLESFVGGLPDDSASSAIALPDATAMRNIEFVTIEREVLYEYLRSLSKDPRKLSESTPDTSGSLMACSSKSPHERRGIFDDVTDRIYKLFLGGSRTQRHTLPCHQTQGCSTSVMPISPSGGKGSDTNDSDNDSVRCPSCPHHGDCGHKNESAEPKLDAPNDTDINTLLDLLDYIREGRATFLSEDLEKITGEKGQKPKTFFDRHGKEFSPNSLSL